MITEWVWVGQGDVLALKKLLLRSSVILWKWKPFRFQTQMVLSTPSLVISKHACCFSLWKKQIINAAVAEALWEMIQKFCFSLALPRILQNSNGFVQSVLCLANLWVESNSISSPSLAHQNWNRDSGPLNFLLNPHRSTSKMQARWLTNLFTNRKKISSHDRHHSPEVDASTRWFQPLVLHDQIRFSEHWTRAYLDLQYLHYRSGRW